MKNKDKKNKTSNINNKENKTKLKEKKNYATINNKNYAEKMMNSDIFVFLDDAQFEKKGWQNRNRRRTKDGTALLSIPVHAHSYPKINEITIDNDNYLSHEHILHHKYRIDHICAVLAHLLL